MAETLGLDRVAVDTPTPAPHHKPAAPGADADTYVEFLALQKTYDGTSLVVRDLNLKIRRGEFLTLLGPSGSGKTTTLMMLAGFEAPTDGRIYLDGASIEDLPPHKRDIGMVFQNYALFPHMTVAQNIAFPLDGAAPWQGGHRRAGGPGVEDGAAFGAGGSAPGPAFRRPAAARGAGPGRWCSSPSWC